MLRAFWAAAAAARAERAVVARAWLRLLATLNAGGHADLLRVAAKRFAKAAVALRALRRWSLACVRRGAAALRAVEPLAVRLARGSKGIETASLEVEPRAASRASAGARGAAGDGESGGEWASVRCEAH